jgi:hypothetical protein
MSKTQVACFLITVCLVNLTARMLEAQEISTIKFMPHDTAGFVHIESPGELANFLDHATEFDSTFFDELVEILFDGKTPVEWSFDEEKFESWKNSLVESLDSLESVTFIVTSTNPLRYRVIFRGEAEKSKVLANLIRSSFEQLNNAMESPETLFSNFDGPWFSHAQPNPFAEAEKEIEPLDLLDDEGGKAYFHQSKDTYVITNESDFNIASTPRKSLASRRRFQRAIIRISDDSAVKIYLDPQRIDATLFDMPTEMTKAWEMDEIAGIGIGIVFPDRDPVAIVHASAAFTFPRIGVGKYWEACRPLEEYPDTGIRFYEFDAINFDPQLQFDAGEEIRNRGKGTKKSGFVRKQNKYWSKSGLNYREDIFPSTAAKFRFRYVEKYIGSEKPSRQLLVAKKVVNFDVAKMASEFLVERLNDSRADWQKYALRDNDVSNEDKVTFVESMQAGRYKAAKGQNHDERTISDKDLENESTELDDEPESRYNREAISVSRNWHLAGEIRAIDNFHGNGEENRSNWGITSVLDRLEELDRFDEVDPLSWNSAANWWVDRVRHVQREKGQDENLENIKFARAKVLCASAFFDQIGTQLHVYSQSDSVMTVRIAIYEKPDILIGKHEDDDASFLLKDKQRSDD